MDRILFIIYHGEVRFVPNREMSCKEYYVSLGGDIKEYDSVIRGMIKGNYIIFMKSNFQYDSEVVRMAKQCAPLIKEQLNKPDLIVCCGIIRGKSEDDWKPMMVVDEYLEESSISDEAKELLERVDYQNNETDSVVDFKNNADDDSFAKYASRFSFVLLLATIIVKVVLYYQHTINFDSRWVSLLIFIQVFSLVICWIGYRIKFKPTKYIGLLASASLFFLFDLADIIIGVLNLLLTIDQGYLVSIFQFIQKLFKKRKV